MRVVIKDNPLSFLTHAKYKILYKDPKMKSQMYSNSICKLVLLFTKSNIDSNTTPSAVLRNLKSGLNTQHNETAMNSKLINGINETLY